MTSIAIYVEGGGDSEAGKAALRQGFDELLSAQKNAARGRRMGWKTVLCGARNAAFDAERVHLMTQCMEAWIVADPEKLEEFYGKGFHKNKLPERQVLDEEPKASLYSALEAATKDTQKGRYGKIKHASEILKRTRPSVLATRCASFRQLTQWLDAAIGI